MDFDIKNYLGYMNNVGYDGELYFCTFIMLNISLNYNNRIIYNIYITFK